MPRGDTKDRLLAAASALFAARGFHATTVRDIAERAGVNLASGHYHYGSKRELYLKVLRAEFAEIRATLARRHAIRPEGELARLSRRELVELLEARVRTMLEVLIGPPPGLHGTLMQREMTDPSEALPVIVQEFILPMRGETERIVSHLAPALDRRQVERSTESIVGQALFFRFCMPAVLRIYGWKSYPRGFSRALAKHITSFSVAGMEAIAGCGKGRRNGR